MYFEPMKTCCGAIEIGQFKENPYKRTSLEEIELSFKGFIEECVEESSYKVDFDSGEKLMLKNISIPKLYVAFTNSLEQPKTEAALLALGFTRKLRFSSQYADNKIKNNVSMWTLNKRPAWFTAMLKDSIKQINEAN